MRIAIVQFPGSNCERETRLAVQRAGMEPVEFLWNESRDKLREMDGYIIVGGFSYEDRSRAGIIAALDPVMQELKAQSETGKPILGICNGAQILVETGLVPGLENHKVGMALAENKRVVDGMVLGTGYYNTWVHLRLADDYQRNAYTRHLTPKDCLHVPIAHGEGRFVMTPALLQEIEMQGLNVFQYCDDQGAIVDRFPINPNGSMRNIAAISNKAGNVMAIMPHPERTPNGDVIFHSMRDYILSGQREEVAPLHYYPRRPSIKPYQKLATSAECIVELIITDNQALTVQNTLHQQGIPVTVRRFAHWEIQFDPAVSDVTPICQQIKQSGVLFNERKEVERSQHAIHSKDRLAENCHDVSATFVVRAKEDLLGQQERQTLQDHFAIAGIQAILHSVLWQFSSKNVNIATLTDQILQTHIIFNPYAHDCYQYNPC